MGGCCSKLREGDYFEQVLHVERDEREREQSHGLEITCRTETCSNNRPLLTELSTRELIFSSSMESNPIRGVIVGRKGF